MANFQAITPPLGQQPWGPVQVFQIPPALGAGPVGFVDIGYPPLDAPFRVLLLKKYPGTIFPDPDLEDVFPYCEPDPIHIEELWAKYTGVLDDNQIYNGIPTTDIAAFIEREVAEWVAELDKSHGPSVFVLADRTFMDIAKYLKSKKRARGDPLKYDAATEKKKSKKRARGDAFEDDAATEKRMSRAAKCTRSDRFISTSIRETPSMKEHYDSAFPAHVVVDQDSPAYAMALSYLKAYAKSHEKYADRVAEIIATQGIESITQRCAKFFAWGLKQAIRSPNEEPATAVESGAEEDDSDDENTTQPLSVAEEDDSDDENATQSLSVAEEDDSDDENATQSLSDAEEDDSDDEIINFQPLNKKPTFKAEKSAMLERLGSFMEEIKVANEDLMDGSMEVSDSDDSHIEMNLGLGILEEVVEDNEAVITEV